MAAAVSANKIRSTMEKTQDADEVIMMAKFLQEIAAEPMQGPFFIDNEGVRNAIAGDTIFIRNGTYYENVVVNKILDIIGEDRNFTIIDGNGSGDVVYVTGYLVSITGFTIQNSGDNTQSGIPDAGIYINSIANII